MDDRAAPPSAETLAKLAFADRMSSAGTLAAGVAHELNSPLAYVCANLAFLADAAARVVAILSGAPPAPGDAEIAGHVQEAMREARTGAERMRTVVRDLATFAGRDEDRHRPVELLPVLASCLNVAWNQVHGRARLVRQLAPVPAVIATEARLGQVFLNLVVNAAEAIPAGRPDDHEIRISSFTSHDGRAAVEVRDTGHGIAEGDLPRIFDPFFTTKSPGVATGLGLSICHAVVTALGGAIEVETAAGRGSTFRVLLPAAGARGASARSWNQS